MEDRTNATINNMITLMRQENDKREAEFQEKIAKEKKQLAMLQPSEVDVADHMKPTFEVGMKEYLDQFRDQVNATAQRLNQLSEEERSILEA